VRHWRGIASGGAPFGLLQRFKTLKYFSKSAFWVIYIPLLATIVYLHFVKT
jgi:hypothetical protein